ncbi:E3 SUMO-protein ligase NSE2-like [Oncorhynchus masou masou]|uniref:E3 SUMO-protein ligase NSE2-like n=1 Tax=Oncorhynchus masou masou TaxID=90313 RepID=UPI00318339B9
MQLKLFSIFSYLDTNTSTSTRLQPVYTITARKVVRCVLSKAGTKTCTPVLQGLGLDILASAPIYRGSFHVLDFNMSLSAVHSTLSSLKTCQTDIGTGMDIVTDVALDVAETAGTENDAVLKKLEVMMLECAKLDQEITCFVEVVNCVTAEVRNQEPEAMFRLKSLVKEKFTERHGRLSEGELQNHVKLVSFKENVRNTLKTVNPEAAEDMDEELDEDVALCLFILHSTSVEVGQSPNCRGALST